MEKYIPCPNKGQLVCFGWLKSDIPESCIGETMPGVEIRAGKD